MHTVTCAGCSKKFKAKARHAKWCTATCRKRAQRRATKTAAAKPKTKATEPDDEPTLSLGLVDSVRAELEAASKVDTFTGQLALQLAMRICTPGETGISALSKELRTVMTALTGTEGTGSSGGPAKPPEPDEDEISRAREARERKTREAAGRA